MSVERFALNIMNIRILKISVLMISTGLLFSLSACRTPSLESEATDEKTSFVEVTVTVGQILKVNKEHGYVVVQCVSLPSKGEGAIVYDGDRVVGRLQITGLINSPFVVADITEGTVIAGNTVKIIRRRRVKKAQEEGRK